MSTPPEQPAAPDPAPDAPAPDAPGESATPDATASEPPHPAPDAPASDPAPDHSPDAPGEQLDEEQLRAAWEEQLRHITTTDVIVQTAVSLINLAGRRLGTAPGSEGERDLGQVRDGIDAVRALLPVLERGEAATTLGPLRDAIAALQVEYAKLVSVPAAGAPTPPAKDAEEPPAGEGPGPAQASGRLWVPGQ